MIKIQHYILNFLDQGNDQEELFQNIIQEIEDSKISKDSHLIHLLEENQVEAPNESYEQLIKESIKYHHNDITNYILFNLINDDIDNIENIEIINFDEKYYENIYSYSFHYYNFAYFPKRNGT